MDWQRACDTPVFNNLPYKVELNRYGRVLMTPVKVKHSFYQGRIMQLLLALLPHGHAIPEFAIQTPDGTRSADVVWTSTVKLSGYLNETAASSAPEICIEVKSAGNTMAELHEKKALYFQVGAQEVWLCSQKGEISFFNVTGQLEYSELVPLFPKQIELI
jgi:Uma2 family endonuclease